MSDQICSAPDIPQVMRTAAVDTLYGILLTDTDTGQQWIADSPGPAAAARDVWSLNTAGLKAVKAQVIRRRVTHTDWEFATAADEEADHG